MNKSVYVIIVILTVAAAMIIAFTWQQPNQENSLPNSEENVYAIYNVTGKGTIEFKVNSTWSVVGIMVYYDPYKVKGGFVSLIDSHNNTLADIVLKHVSKPSGIWGDGEGVSTDFFKLKGTTCKIQYSIDGNEPVKIEITYQ